MVTLVAGFCLLEAFRQLAPLNKLLSVVLEINWR